MSASQEEPFPVHDSIDVEQAETIFKEEEWWKAAILYEGWRGPEIAVYLWQANDDGGWRRKQKYVVRSLDDWQTDKQAIEKLIGGLN